MLAELSTYCRDSMVCKAIFSVLLSLGAQLLPLAPNLQFEDEIKLCWAKFPLALKIYTNWTLNNSVICALFTQRRRLNRNPLLDAIRSITWFIAFPSAYLKNNIHFFFISLILLALQYWSDCGLDLHFKTWLSTEISTHFFSPVTDWLFIYYVFPKKHLSLISLRLWKVYSLIYNKAI